MAGLRTEFPFVLPKGWVDGRGKLHREGRMRLATARDELESLEQADVNGADDPRLTLVVLSRVIVGLGERDKVAVRDLEGLFAADLEYLQDVYAAINYGTQQDIDLIIASDGRVAPLTTLDVDLPAAPAPAPPAPAVAPAKLRAVTPAPVVDEAPVLVDIEESEPAGVEPEPEVEQRPLLTGRRARIEEVGRSSGPRTKGAR